MHDLDMVIHELLPDSRTVSESMRLLIDAHAEVYPDGNWSPYYSIPYDGEIRYLQEHWLRTVITNQPPAKVPVAGLWFGLFHPVKLIGGKHETVTDFYLSGADRFVLDGGIDWAVRPKYFPEGRYAHSEVLAAIYRTAFGEPGGLEVDAEEFLCLGYVAFVLKQVLSEIDPELIVSSAEPVGVAVGWDAGDPYYYGFLTRDGFQIRKPSEAIEGIKKQRQEFAGQVEGIDNLLASLDPQQRAALESLLRNSGGIPDPP